MLLNLSGAHGPWFTRNIVILTDSAGNTGLGEVPGGEKIRQTIEDARHLRGRQAWATEQRPERVRRASPTATRADAAQTFDLRTTVHVQ